MPTPSHGYVLDGRKVPGVTTVVGRYKDSGALNNWIWRLGTRREDFHAAGRAAADIGTAVHDMIEQDANGKAQSPLDSYGLPPKGELAAMRCWHAYCEWRDTRKPVFEATEIAIIHRDLGYGGTIDAVGSIDGVRYLFDWKTSNGIYDETSMQIAAYRELWHHHTGEFLERALIVRMDKAKGKYQELVAPMDHCHYFAQFTRLLDALKGDKEVFPCKWTDVTGESLC